MSDDLLMNELASELTRLTADPRQRGNNDYLKNFVKMPEDSGYVVVRILEAHPGKKWTEFYVGTRTHKLGERNIHCPRRLVGGNWMDNLEVGKCPICEYYTWLYSKINKGASDSEALVAEARAIRAIERYYYNVIVRDNAETGQGEADGSLILSVGKTVHTKILQGVVGDKKLGMEPLGKVWNPKGGYDFRIVKTMKPGGNYPDYSGSAYANKPSLLGTDAQIKDWLAKRHDIFALRKVLDIETLKKELRIYRGAEEDPRQSFDPSEYMPKAKTQQKPASSTKVDAIPEVNDVELDPELAGDEFIQNLMSNSGQN